MSWLATGALDWIWRAAEEWSVPVGLAVRGNLAQVERIAILYPRLRILIDHMGAGHAGKVPDVFGHFPELIRLAGFSNVAVKATAAPAYATDGYPFRSVHGHLHKLFDAYGPDRMFWGTDIDAHALHLAGVRHDVQRRAAADRSYIGPVLGAISADTYKEYGLFLTVLVHRKTAGTTKPGPGFQGLFDMVGRPWKFEDRTGLYSILKQIASLLTILAKGRAIEPSEVGWAKAR